MPLATPCTQVDDLVVKTLIAAEPTISQSIHDNIPSSNRGEPNRTCFQVFGFDVMLDAHAKPWLLEVNLDPALRTESPLDLKIKSQMIIDLLNVVGMPVPPPPPPPPEPGEEGEEGEGVGGGEEGSKAAVDVSDAAGASTSGAGGGSSSAAEGADGAPLKTPRATGFGSGVLPTPLFEDAHQAAADWKRRRAADILEAQSDPSLASPATTGAASSSSTTAAEGAAKGRLKHGLHKRVKAVLKIFALLALVAVVGVVVAVGSEALVRQLDRLEARRRQLVIGIAIGVALAGER